MDTESAIFSHNVSNDAHQSATDSEMSDPPSNLSSDCDSDHADHIPNHRTAVTLYGDSSIGSSNPRKHGLSTPYACDSDGSDDDASPPRKRCRTVSPTYQLSAFEQLPTEILEKIASDFTNDQEISTFTSACKSFAKAVNPDNSIVWKYRFLSRYDYPFVDQFYTFQIAYKLRRFVLRKFVDFSNCKDRRAEIQLEVLRDMVLETYHSPQFHTPTPTNSRNLAAFSSPEHSTWMVAFLSSPFFNYGHRKYGEANSLFDALQLMMSHLLLSPASRMAHAISTSRTNYDLVKVYNWNQPFSTLYTRASAPTPRVDSPSQEFRSTLFPNLRNTRSRSPEPIYTYGLDLNTLLHVRNFWQRHLIDDSNGFISDEIAEHTYAEMAHTLMRKGITPQKWHKPLQNVDANKEGLLKGKWHGHYSTLQPWPKSLMNMLERQSDAEDWEVIDPLVLDFATSTDNQDDCFWPPVFSTIPAFADTTPEIGNKTSQIIYIRGIAPFLELDPDHKPRSASVRQDPLSALSKYHPLLSLRMRGIVHSIADQSGIPGWQRILMVMYKPNTRYLIQVLEHDQEEYGNPFSVTITSQIQNQAQSLIQQNTTLNQSTTTGIVASNVMTSTTQSTNTAPTTSSVQNSVTQPPSQDEQERLMQEHLLHLVQNNPAYSPSALTRDRIEELEEQFSLSEFLEWVDMEYAYAYEGVVLPGGKLMLGRWWRIGEAGTGPGKELDAMGFDANDADNDETSHGDEDNSEPRTTEESPVNGESISSAALSADGSANSESTQTRTRKKKDLERGPFIFWC